MTRFSFPARPPGWLQRCPDAVLLLAARVFPAAVFWQSGRTKLDGWQLNDNVRYLFREEYRLPWIDPDLAAMVAATAEHVLPLLLLLGLATRISALALLAMTAVIQIFVYPDAWPTHGTWAALFLLLATRGGGAWSLDRLLSAPLRSR
jgi:putative oxidoreductase